MNMIPPSRDRYIVQYTLRLFLRPHSMSTQAGFSLVFGGIFLLSSLEGKGIFTDYIIRLWNFLNLSPFSKLGFSAGHQSPTWNCRVGQKKLQRKQQLLCCACRYWRVTPSTQMCTLPLCRLQPRPSRHCGIGCFWYLAQYQIRGVSPNAVDLRVFLVFATNARD